MKKPILISMLLASAIFAADIKFEDAKSKFSRTNPEFADDVVLSYHSSISDAKNSVVNISTTKTLKGSANNPMMDMFDDPFFKQFFGFNFNMPQESDRKSSSLGSGVIISKDGYIITNNHVIENADEIVITLLSSDKEYKAKLIGADPKTDLAIIKIDAKDLSAIKFADSNNIMEGDIVFAIGNPFGVGGTITQGIISALNKDNIGLNQYENFIQTDASINPGNSGGALVDSRGALIGINSAILSRSGGNNGIGFAIPSNMVKDIATKLITEGKIERGYIGVMIGDLSKDLQEIYKSKEGALVSSVEAGLPADKAGLKRGDLIIKIDDKSIKNANELKNIIGSMKPDQEIKVEYERAGKTSTAKLKLANMENTSSASINSNTLNGLELQELNDELKQQYRLSSDTIGVLVTGVEKESKAYEYGFRKGDIIIQIGEHEVKNIADFNKYTKETKGNKTLVWVIRKGVPLGIVIK